MSTRYKPSSLSVIEDWMEYTGLSKADIEMRIAACLQHSADEWHRSVEVTNPDSVQTFYTQTDYIYEVLHAYTAAFAETKPRTLQRCLTEGSSRLPPHARVLDFGGGTGELCLWLSSYFDNVTYVDMPGRLMDFAKWRFKKYKADVAVIETSATAGELPANTYDMVFSDAALEHVVNLDYWLGLLLAATKPNGYLLLIIDHVQSADYPMHISAAEDPEQILRKKGALVVGRQLYVKADSTAAHVRNFTYRLRRKLKKSLRLKP